MVDRQFGTHLQRAGHILVGRFIEPVRGSAGRGFGVPSGALPSIGEFLLVPLFAFVRIRVLASGPSTSVWDRDLEAHQRIIHLLREGEGDVIEQYVRMVMTRFGATAYDNWENRAPASKKRSKR